MYHSLDFNRNIGFSNFESINGKDMKRKLTTAGIAALFITGFLILMYPIISDLWNQFRTENLISVYRDETDSLTDEDIEREFQAAKEYNAEHIKNTVIDPFEVSGSAGKEYNRILDPSGNGIMGYIEIPAINQRLAIYHGTKNKVLEKGCGHIAGTSLPVGGKSTHAVIAAHRGLPQAKLFTDLDKLDKGDRFYIFILNKTLAYEVDQIKVAEPDCLDELQITEGKDQVTLFTCTPYSVTTHRLLVRGHRVKYIPKENNTQTTSEAIHNSWIIRIMAVLLAIAIVAAVGRRNAGKGGG